MSAGWVCAIFFALGWVPVFVFRVEETSAALPYYSREERVAVLLTPIVIAVHMALSSVLLTLEPSLPVWRASVALLIFAGGAGFWMWGRWMIGPITLRRLPDEPPLEFRQDGAFGIVRHPLYFGTLVMAAATVIALAKVPVVVSYAGCVLLIAVRAVQEERRLREQLGDRYEQYARRVRRLIPFVW